MSLSASNPDYRHGTESAYVHHRCSCDECRAAAAALAWARKTAEVKTVTAADVLRDVRVERERQDAKWGVQDHDDFTWSAILGEEVGEVCQAALEHAFADSENHSANVYRELIEVAAVAQAWAECIRRNEAYRVPEALT